MIGACFGARLCLGLIFMDADGNLLDEFGSVLPAALQPQNTRGGADSSLSWLKDTLEQVQEQQPSASAARSLEDSYANVKARVARGDYSVDITPELARFHSKRHRGRTLLMEAAKAGQSQCMLALLKHHYRVPREGEGSGIYADLNAQSKKLFTALHYAAYAGHVDCLRLCIVLILRETKVTPAINAAPCVWWFSDVIPD